MRTVAVVTLFVLSAIVVAQEAPPANKIKVAPFKLVKIVHEKPDPNTLVLWRVSPSKDVDRASTVETVLEFTAPPGVYTVEKLVCASKDGKPTLVEEVFYTVEIDKCCDKVPPVVTPPTPKDPPVTPPAPKPKPDPVNALGRIQFGNAGCTATVVWPRRSDGRWDLLTAEHCVDAVPIGARGQMQLRNSNSRIGVVLVSRESKSDIAWLVTDSADLADLPFAILADKTPAPGTKIWHAGYGVHIPGNREDGEILQLPNSDNQVQYALSVSSGDSGGGIFNNETGELLSPVCCTTQKNVKARVWGGSPERATQLRPKPRAETDDVDNWFRPTAIPERKSDFATERTDWFQPTPIPERRSDASKDDWFKPVPMPERK